MLKKNQFVFLLIILFSCKYSQNIVYINENVDVKKEAEGAIYEANKIQAGDYFDIKVSSYNAVVASTFNFSDQMKPINLKNGFKN